MFQSRIIEKRVLGVIREKIAEKQTEFDVGKKEINLDALKSIEEIKEESEASITKLADKCVNDIIGKIL